MRRVQSSGKISAGSRAPLASISPLITSTHSCVVRFFHARYSNVFIPSAAAELPGEDADGDRRQNMVEPAERMRETVNETVRVADTGMGEGGGGNEREGGGRQANAHGRSLVSAK